MLWKPAVAKPITICEVSPKWSPLGDSPHSSLLQPVTGITHKTFFHSIFSQGHCSTSLNILFRLYQHFLFNTFKVLETTKIFTSLFLQWKKTVCIKRWQTSMPDMRPWLICLADLWKVLAGQRAEQSGSSVWGWRDLVSQGCRPPELHAAWAWLMVVHCCGRPGCKVEPQTWRSSDAGNVGHCSVGVAVDRTLFFFFFVITTSLYVTFLQWFKWSRMLLFFALA